MSRKQSSEIIISLTGGLGNQLFQLAAAINLSNGNAVNIEWDLGEPRLNHDSIPDVMDFQWPENIILMQKRNPGYFQRKLFSVSRRINISSKKYRDLPGISLLTFITSLMLSIYVRRIVWYEAGRGVGFQEIKKSKKSTFLTGYFQSYRWPLQIHTLQILNKIELRNPSQEFVGYQKLAKTEKPIIAHVRLGDYKNETTFGIPNSNYYRKSLDQLNLIHPESPIWIFSNELDLARKYLPEEYLNRYKFVDDSKLTPSEILELMRYGKAYVIANSTFSWWAAFLSYEHSPKIICPKPWFQPQEEPKDLIPPDWERFAAWE